MNKNNSTGNHLTDKVPIKHFLLIMRTALILLFLCVFYSMANIGYTQNARVTINKRNATIKEVLNEIESQSDYLFIYNDEVNTNEKVSVRAKQEAVSEVLNSILDDKEVTYSMEGNHIILSYIETKNKEEKKEVIEAIAQQGKTVTGKVTDIEGESLPGVTVIIKGTTKGTITDIDGNFMLSNISENATLQFSFVGMHTEEVETGNQRQINVTLMGDVIGLDEVVAIGYGVARKSDLTGAISHVIADEFNKFSPSNIGDLLRTSVPGLNVGYGISAKGNSSLKIRGETTLTAGSSPLIVLDGSIYSGDLSDINPNDIDRMDVLKDASSAAVYGSRATNGVIVITTKRGIKDKSTITFNSTLGVATPSHRSKPYDAEGFIRWRSDMYKSNLSGTVPSDQWSPFDDPRTIDQQYLSEWLNYHSTNEENMVSAWLGSLRLTGIEIENYIAGNSIDWEDIIYQNGIRKDYNISLSGKKDDVTYYWSLGYMDNEALTIGDEFSTIRSRLNLEGRVAEFLKVGLNAQFSYRDQSSVPLNSDQYPRLTPFSSYYEDDGVTLKLYPNDDIQSGHPLLNRAFTNTETEFYRLDPKIYSILELPFGITYTMNYTTSLEFYHNYNHQSSEHPEWGKFGGAASRMNRLIREWQVDNIFNWGQTFFNVHKVDVTLLQNAEKYRFNSETMSNRNFEPNDILGYYNMKSGTLPTMKNEDATHSADALMARVNYGYNRKYLLTLSLRRDGSSIFGYSNPRATFPAVGFGWVLTEEDFFKSDFANYLKLRASWGKNGNRDIGYYSALSRMQTGKILNSDQSGSAFTIPTLSISTMENRGLKWEQTAATNLGIDFNLFNGVLSGSVDAYKTSTKDVLVNRLLPTITGFSRVYANLGEVKNKGLEIKLNSKNIEQKNFEWNSSFIFSLNRNKIVTITGEEFDVYDTDGNIVGRKEPDDIKNNWFIGQDRNVIWDYKILGTWKIGEEDEAAKWSQRPGDFKLLDYNNDGLMTDEDKQYQGNTSPRFTWTFSNNFTIYKNFDLSFVLFSIWGHKSPFNAAKHDDKTLERANIWDVPYWTPENPLENYARLLSAPAKGVAYSAWFDKSHIRLENIALTFDVPKSLLNRTFINNLKVSFNIRNAAVWAPHWKFGDPVDGTRAPRIYSFGLNMTI